MKVKQRPGASRSVHAPQQARSQETFERFLAATGELLAERNFDDISVTDIVARAERTVGSFYARFDDKYAALHELVERSYEEIRVAVTAFCDPLRWEHLPLSAYVHEFVRMFLDAEQRDAPLYRAASCAAICDERFRQSRFALLRFCADQQKALILARRFELKAADPGRASDLMIEIVVAMLEDDLLFGRFTRTPADDDQLCAELTEVARQVLGLSYAHEGERCSDGSDAAAATPAPAAPAVVRSLRSAGVLAAAHSYRGLSAAD